MSSNYNMQIYVQKTKIMVFVAKYPLRTKIVLDNKCIEQVSHFCYFGCDVTYDVDYDVDHKSDKFQSICGTIRQSLSRKTREGLD